MKAKIFAILLTAMIALNILGFSYAGRNGKIKINGQSNNFKCYFVNVICSDNEKQKDVANVTAAIINRTEIIVAITNGYPCYEAYVNFTIRNEGEKTVHICSVSLENPNPTAIEVTVTNLTCTNLAPGNATEGVVTTHVLQTAQQCSTYIFKITIQLCYPIGPGTPGFWKRQFKAQTDPDSLETYLNQINASSIVFNGSFTGTRQQKFDKAIAILSAPPRGGITVKFKAHLLALWLNYLSGLANGYTIDGLTAIEIIEGSENVLLYGPPDEYELWKDRCDAFNNL